MTALFKQQPFIDGVLGNTRLFVGIPRDEIAALASRCWVVAARRGDTLARSGERLPGLFVMGYGQATLALRAPGQRERVLRIVTAGQSFGAAAALLGRASGYDVRALVDAKVIVVPSASIVGLADRQPRFSGSLLRMLAERVLDLCAEVGAGSLHSGGQRLASYLDALAEPIQGNGGWSVRLPVSKTVVAARLGMKKETLSRLLRRLAADGLIEVSRGDIAILDRAALTRLLPAHRDRM